MDERGELGCHLVTPHSDNGSALIELRGQGSEPSVSNRDGVGIEKHQELDVVAGHRNQSVECLSVRNADSGITVSGQIRTRSVSSMTLRCSLNPELSQTCT